LDNRKAVVVIAVSTFVLSIGVAARLGSEFLPELNEGTFWVNWDMPASQSQEQAISTLNKARKVLMTVPEVRTVVSKAGQPEDGTDPKTLSMAEVFVDVKPHEEWRKGMTRDKLIDEMDRKLSVIPSVDPAFSQTIRDNVLASISHIKGQIVVKVSGEDLG
jgi:cobalt-zinc-cadmium resistance protein CzcA